MPPWRPSEFYEDALKNGLLAISYTFWEALTSSLLSTVTKFICETLVTVVLPECEKAACLRCQRAAKATHPVGEAALPHFISYCLCVILRLNAELQLLSTSVLLRPQSLLFMYVCVCYENCHQRPVCVCMSVRV